VDNQEPIITRLSTPRKALGTLPPAEGEQWCKKLVAAAIMIAAGGASVAVMNPPHRPSTKITFRTGAAANADQAFGDSTPIAITTSSLPGAKAGTTYSATLAASGGTPPYTWSAISGQLPTGLTLSGGGVISGIPSASGTFFFTVQVKDSAGSPQAATQSESIAVAAVSSSSTAYFGTLPPGSTLPSDSDCSSRVRYSSWEPRPDNYTANHTTGITGVQINGASSSFNSKYAGRINGSFTGTTDEILQWGACKWGLDEDIQRARATQESWWHQSQLGDYTTSASLCSVIGKSAPCYQSYGLLQVKPTIHIGTWPYAQTSTPFNVDYALAWQRACFEGAFTWLGNGYGAGDIWGCVGAWFSGSWYDSGAQAYISSVKNHLANKQWLQPGF
jgi:Putative Ig domain